jgi:hypothetical protein
MSEATRRHMTAAEWRTWASQSLDMASRDRIAFISILDNIISDLAALEAQEKAHEQIVASWKREEHGWDEERARLLVEAKAHAEQLSALKLREVALIGDWELLHPFTKHGEVKSAFMDRLERFAKSMENLKQDSPAPTLATPAGPLRAKEKRTEHSYDCAAGLGGLCDCGFEEPDAPKEKWWRCTGCGRRNIPESALSDDKTRHAVVVGQLGFGEMDVDFCGPVIVEEPPGPWCKNVHGALRLWNMRSAFTSPAPALAEMRERLAMEVCAIRLGITKGENEIIAGVWKRQPEEHRKQYLVEADRLLSALIGGTA